MAQLLVALTFSRLAVFSRLFLYFLTAALNGPAGTFNCRASYERAQRAKQER
jgi:hypothetical protein